ncbi:MAG: hypothetical protein FWF76_03335 [Oscillospiraceae bacterium]|nr:hypothetical protein [Oscillospiraceae bacterium]
MTKKGILSLLVAVIILLLSACNTANENFRFIRDAFNATNGEHNNALRHSLTTYDGISHFHLRISRRNLSDDEFLRLAIESFYPLFSISNFYLSAYLSFVAIPPRI